MVRRVRTQPVDLRGRLSRRFSLTTEPEFDIRGTEADPTDPWLVSSEGSPYYEYTHLEAACLLDFSLAQGWAWRLSDIASVGFQLQTSASIRTDSGGWELIDISDELQDTGPSLILGVGFNGFLIDPAPRGQETKKPTYYGSAFYSIAGAGLEPATSGL